MNARVAILTGEIAAARAEMANQAELAKRAMRKSEEFKAQIAAVTSQNAKLKTRHLTQVNQVNRIEFLSDVSQYVGLARDKLEDMDVSLKMSASLKGPTHQT